MSSLLAELQHAPPAHYCDWYAAKTPRFAEQVLQSNPYSCVCAGSVAPGTSASVEIFTADLLISQPGIQASFTYKPASSQQTPLELWCWFEPSNDRVHVDTDFLKGAAKHSEGRDNTRQKGSHGVANQGTDQGTGDRGVDVEQQRVVAMLQPEGCVLVCPSHTRESSTLRSQ